MNYTVVIQWSDEDQCFVVTLPEFTDVMQPVTHGETYEEALKNAQEVMDLLIELSRTASQTVTASRASAQATSEHSRAD